MGRQWDDDVTSYEKMILSDILEEDEDFGEDFENGHIFTIALEGRTEGVQAIPDDITIDAFNLGQDVIRFEEVIGGTLNDLDNNLESVADTGDEITFYFIGGGSLTLHGVSGYSDFTSLSADYHIEIL